MKQGRGETGQVAVLVLGLALVAFAVGGVAIDGTRAFIFRRSLQNIADASVLAAAGELDRSTYYASGGRRIQLDVDAARRRASQLLQSRGFVAEARVAVEASGVAVVLRGDIPTTFLGVVGVTRIPVAVEARAEPFSGSPD